MFFQLGVRGRLDILQGCLPIHEDVSLDMVMVLLWVQQLFPNLME